MNGGAATGNPLVGVISDTHGRLPRWVFEHFRGVDLILHAGDIGHPKVIAELEALAPVVAVPGNSDRGAWAWEMPLSRCVTAGGRRILLVHDLAGMPDPPPGTAVVVHGHTHRSGSEYKDGVLYLNPGSPVRPRGEHPSIARLRPTQNPPQAEIIRL
ncbi:MAG TPA: metallophosphoesterase family protein [bacterium]|nr:metallophosphoesterase family protein [bacterium]HPQ66692.1 metallophosphoesterase family protein [bacterium]